MKIHPALRVPPTKTLAEQIEAMQRRRDEARAKVCAECGGPLRGITRGPTIGGCRVCFLMSDRGLVDTAGNRWRPWSGRSRINLHGDCNSTEDSPATSEWLPRVWVGPYDSNHAPELTLISQSVVDGRVVWFRRVDYAEVRARDTILARSLTGESAQDIRDAARAWGDR